jgi:FkbM family methyltransferase
MSVKAAVKRGAAGPLRVVFRKLGTRQLAGVLRRGTSDDEMRALLAELLNKQHLVVEVERGGERWWVPTGDEIFIEIFCTGSYQTGDVAVLDSWVTDHLDRGDNEVVIDVGANIGTTTCPLAELGYQVIAIEPVPETFAILERNVGFRSFGDRVSTANVAIADGPTSVELVTTRGSGCSEVALSGAKPAFGQWGLEPTGSVTVKAERLDALVQRLGVTPGRVRYVWSDTQGCEGDVIRTGVSLWSSGVPLYVEVWPEALDRRYGIDAFVKTVETTFAGFVSKDDLRDPTVTRPRPIDGFGTFVRDLDRWTDALLVP